MKKITLVLMMACLSLTILPVTSNATIVEPTVTIVASKAEEKAHAETLILRLKEINAMDKSNLNSSEKKELRKEVKTIKRELRESNGGIYLSVGAILIIILLLVILL
jgi:hypothetical protein